ncbi:MAG: zinc ribbon domain-containing protein [SAR202 cluster bacterium]|nr:zinc ribbon domain-containing protein [SAR202 cluster bacterium]
MPIYEYSCEKCSNEFELRQSFSAEPVTACPKCEGTSRRVIRAVPVVFKGSGFYVNDYGKKNVATSKTESDKGADEKKAEVKAETKAESKAEAKAEAKTETKSETKKEAVAY